MVVLAASITTRQGKPLLSRQFKDLSKDRVLELLSNFQNLVSEISSDHTFVEDKHVRYVYRPFDNYYIILITNRQSNIIKDLATLNLFSQTINSYLSSFQDQEIFHNAFEILSSFDEIVSMGGYKENLSFTQVQTYLSMESHEERIQEIIERNKEIEATEERKRRAKEIARKEHERKHGFMSSNGDYDGANRFMASKDPNVTNAINSYYSHASPAAQQSYLQSAHAAVAEVAPMASPIATSQRTGSSSTGGMKLGGSAGRRTGAAPRPSAISSASSSAPPPPEEDVPENNGILISIKEVINAEFSRDGTIHSSELKGVLELRINDHDLSHSNLKLADSIDVRDKSFQFKTHPNIDKQSFLSTKLISLRDKSKAFPANDQSLGVLRWRKIAPAEDDSLVPLTLTTWVSPSESQQGFDVIIEYENVLETELSDVVFTIPVFPQEPVDINTESSTCSDAEVVNMDQETGTSIKISKIGANDAGALAFTIEAPYEDALYPMTVSFQESTRDKSAKSFTGMAIQSVVMADDHDQELPYDVITSLKSDEYLVQ
ncbi:AHL_G0017660.mRNA.1.CDS.1 [Saccharomyces cerevisiae]|uniref:Coatomer subunit delta n=1 Tax=Saccharomyces paradoxus TaxID=27291 RepID=A0A8B8UR12_SACPA|nr:Ret2 [Saccharomyces paradoxus]AJU39886.1 Ret2p [Saccharomyces cerevisiae YJM1252]CAI4439157.1 CPG_1a_G0017690.mRNA.1.CDS.1 [Saccharomyces cerevisiae]QHS73084.1 Ret2 [Saccharomyces paradoxus]CAI4456096.1 AVB_G0017390.mRNA.1.CDS.1 [Saccharomyces cerevisiae]CAI4880317.1 AHL_G0017660.mRNA.1.CDS.1 [Saccharomyces cerevisiae]